MRALFLAHSFPRHAGDPAGSFLLRLATALRDQDVEVLVIAPSAEGLASQETIEGIEVERFRYAPRRMERLAYTGNMASDVQRSWSARVALLGFLGSDFVASVLARRRFQPDVLHAHWWFPGGLVGTWLASLSSVPLVTTLHGTDVRLARTVGAARAPFRHVLHKSAAVTSVSRWLARETEEIVPRVRPVVAPMPVDTDRFTPDHTPRGDRLLFVGRLNQQKGIEHLVRALALTRTPVGLDVVGEGPLGPSLRALATELGVADRIRWLGALPHGDMPARYREAAALVVPSIEEGLGLVAVESLLCGTPVIASESGGLPDVIQHDRTGVLVPPADPPALAAAIDQLLADRDRGRALGEAGRMHALATFAPESAARRYAEVYRGATARRDT